MEKLFIYGTLAPGCPNAHIMADIPGTWEPATVNGHLREGGWGSAIGYPGIILDEDGTHVKGLIFSSEQLAAHWERLDDFEGDGYQRVLTVATKPDNSQVEVYIYALSEEPA